VYSALGGFGMKSETREPFFFATLSPCLSVAAAVQQY
jgi:hypothetical protein